MVDALHRLSRDPATYQPLYEGAWLRLLDSRVVRRLARLLGLPAPPVVTGSDLTAALVRDAAAAGEWVTILGLTRSKRRSWLPHQTSLSAPRSADRLRERPGFL